MKPPSLNVFQKNCQMRVTRKNSFPDWAPLHDKCYWKTFSSAKCPSITLPYSQVSVQSVRANVNFALFTGRMSGRPVMRGGTVDLLKPPDTNYMNISVQLKEEKRKSLLYLIMFSQTVDCPSSQSCFVCTRFQRNIRG